MSKLSSMGVASRFALLRIEDDDDDDDEEEEMKTSKAGQSMNKKKSSGGKKAKFLPVTTKDNQKNVAKQRSKTGKKNKAADDVEWEEDSQLQEALQLSQVSYEAERQQRNQQFGQEQVVGPSPRDEEEQRTEEVEAEEVQAEEEDDEEEEDEEGAVSRLAKQTSLEAKKVLHQFPKATRQPGDTAEMAKALYKLYFGKFQELVKLATSMEEETASSKAEMDKAKKRVKNLCQLLNDAETREKAELAAERRKVAGLNEELTQQVSEMHAELEQARSRVHELEDEINKLKQCKASK